MNRIWIAAATAALGAGIAAHYTRGVHRMPGQSSEEASAVRLNTVGFLPGQQKRASVAAKCEEFAVVREPEGDAVLRGRVSGPTQNPDTGEELWVADFTALRQPGSYRLDVPGVGRSAPFRIALDVYADPFRTATRAMYLWRCGTAVKGEHQGAVFAHGPCHLEDAWLDFVGGGHTRRNGVGGWHDAGDYNKYVVNAGITVGAMLRAWEDFEAAIRPIPLDIPRSSQKLPEFLEEIKYETDWLLTMQADDGSVYHKISTKSFGGFILPEDEKAERYFTPWSSAATADFVAMLASAARSFRPFDAEYSRRCLEAAEKSYAFLRANPENRMANLAGFQTGGYQTRDPDERIWAAAELWETTGRSEVLQDLQTRLAEPSARVDRDFDWGEVRNLGIFTYLNSKRPGRDPAIVKRLGEELVRVADEIVQTAGAHGYARPLGSRYYWGCNGSVARQSLILLAANRLTPARAYVQTSLDGLSHLLGRNPFGRSYVTGVGYRPPMRPHDRRSGGDRVDPPWPGYLVGGPHPKATDWFDVQDDYRTNEIAINWNGALIYALAAHLAE